MIKQLTALKNNKGFIRYLKNSGWMMGEQLLRIISGLFVGIWVARYLGPEQFGLFSYVIAFASIFSGIAKLGLDGIVIRELVNNPGKRDKYLGTAFWLKFIGAFVVMFLIITILPFTNNDIKTNCFIIIITFGLIFQCFEIVEFYFQSKVLAKISSICKVIQLSFSSIIKIFLVINEAELLWFVVFTAFDMLSLAVSYFVAYKTRKNPSFFKCFDINIAKKLLRDSWPLIFTAIVIIIYMRIDQIMIKELLGVYEVGLYSAAVKLSEAFYFIPMIITASLFPAILNAKNNSEKLYRKRLQRLYTFMVWLAVMIAIPMTFLSDWLVLILFGQVYQEAGQVLIIHIWAGIFVFLGVSFSKYLLTENLTKIAFKRTMIGAISNIILNLWMIPVYGVKGAAIATLLSQFIANLGYDFFDKQLHEQLVMKLKAIFFPWNH